MPPENVGIDHFYSGAPSACTLYEKPCHIEIFSTLSVTLRSFLPYIVQCNTQLPTEFSGFLIKFYLISSSTWRMGPLGWGGLRLNPGSQDPITVTDTTVHHPAALFHSRVYCTALYCMGCELQLALLFCTSAAYNPATPQCLNVLVEVKRGAGAHSRLAFLQKLGDET